MTAPDLLVCPSCNRQKEEFWPDGFCGPDICLNPDCNSQVATPAPAAMTPEMRALVDEVKFIRDTILKNTRDADGPHTITMPDGSVHTGPLVDLWHNINALIVRRLTDRLDALAALRGEVGNE